MIAIQDEMNNPLPSFRKPPVVETALSVQFLGLRDFTNAHLGLFWSRLRDEFPHLSDADPIVSQREVFGDDRMKLAGPPRVRFGTDPNARLQMASADRCQMVQIQNGRLVFNWRRIEDTEYPRWGSVKSALLEYWSSFLAFLDDSGIKSPHPNQWEIVYVNHLKRGYDWQSPDDWAALVPGLLGPSNRLVDGRLESLSLDWHIALDDDRGRLHIDLNHALAIDNSEQNAEPMEILNLQLTARGGVGEGDDTIEAGLELGHLAIVQNFAAITSEEAQVRWGRQP